MPSLASSESGQIPQQDEVEGFVVTASAVEPLKRSLRTRFGSGFAIGILQLTERQLLCGGCGWLGFGDASLYCLSGKE